MSYDAKEISIQDGAPIELYDFSMGAVQWHFTSSAESFFDEAQSDAVEYSPAAISRTNIASSPEDARNRMTMTVARTHEIAELFRISPPSETVGLIIRRVHAGDTTDIIAIWVGRVVGCSFEGAAAKLTCEPVLVSMKRSGLRRLYGRGCPHVLYGPACGLDKAGFAHSTTVDSIDGAVMTVTSIDVGFTYGGGFVEWVNDDGITDRRFITSADGSDLTLLMPFQGISASDPVTIYPGCNHTIATCDAVFGNVLNYGGQPFFPTKNPFRGDPVV